MSYAFAQFGSVGPKMEGFEDLAHQNSFRSCYDSESINELDFPL
jgi:hypothetical protein